MALDRKEYMRKYHQSEKGKAIQKKYQQSERGKAIRKKYEQSEKFKAYRKKYEQSEKFKAIQKKYQQSEKFKAYQKKYYQSEKGKAIRKKYEQSEKYKANRKEYWKSEKGKAVHNKWRKSEVGQAWVKSYMKNYAQVEENKAKRVKSVLKYYKENTMGRLARGMRNRLKEYLKYKNISQTNKTFQYIGCTPKELKTYIENKFQPGMTWDNWGVYGWHIDHVVALSSAKTEDELMKLFHYTNLQPLWAKDNILKSDKVIPQNSS